MRTLGESRINVGTPCAVVFCVLGMFQLISAQDDSTSLRVKALLAQKCLSCHSGDEAKGKFDVSTRESLLSGGESGPGFVAGESEKSLIWHRVEQDEMPPKHPLSAVEKRLILDWIHAGAIWSGEALDPLALTTEHRAGFDWWSLQPLRPVRIPRPNSPMACRQPIDDFVVEKLEARELSMSPEADRRTLIRRLSFDLLGLPPSPEDVDHFMQENRPDAYERLVDSLLASPHYGERWARHWLDVVRFGESNGFERDLPRPNAWHYRDWVVAAFNRDLPYDEFARWQLAGDVLAPDDIEAVKGVGFLVAGAHDTVVPVVDRMRAMMRQDELEDIVGTVGQTFLGLTVNCARCHDHKFDPITTREYYQLASALSGVDHGEREFTPPDVGRQLAENQTRIDELSKNLRDQESSVQELMLTEQANFEAEILSKLTEKDRSIRLNRQAELSELQLKQPQLAKSGLVRIYTAIATQSPPMKIHKRGSVSSLGDAVEPAGIAAVRGLASDFDLRPDAIESHRRLKLANWITDARNPLFARVMVNRVWYYHFGVGLVDSPNDFGFHAGMPSHPDLLEWLAGEFAGTWQTQKSELKGTEKAESGSFSLKRLHRVLLNSAAYRQSSQFRLAAANVDANNRFVWRMAPKRLEAEEVRDAMLVVAGELNREMSGKGFSDVNSYFFKGTQFYEPIDPVGHTNNRRTLYRFGARGGRSPFLDTFDCPDPSTTTPKRSATVTPIQALSMLNHSFSLRMADHFADRLSNESARTENLPTRDFTIRRAFRLLYGRLPDDEEMELSHRLISHRGLPEFCRAMWNSSEFLYVD